MLYLRNKHCQRPEAEDVEVSLSVVLVEIEEVSLDERVVSEVALVDPVEVKEDSVEDNVNSVEPV